MNKNILTAIIVLVILLAGIGLITYVNKEEGVLSKEKIFTFDNYTLLQNKIEILSNQNNVDKEIFSKIESGDYKIENPLVLVNPYGISPLTAIIGFKTDKKVEVTVTVKAKPGGKDLIYTTKESEIHYLPIYGLYLDHVNQVEIKYDNEVKTIEIPVEVKNIQEYFFPDVVINKNNLPQEDNDFYFMSTPLGAFASAYDQTGEVRWFLSSQIYKQLTRLPNGNFLLSSPESIGNQSLGFVEVDLLGKVYNSYNLANPYLDNYVELPNGNIIYASTNNRIIEYNLKNGEVVKIYDINQIIKDVDENQLKSFEENFDFDSLKDFNLINSLDYDTSTNSILVGIYHYSTLLNLNKNGQINWMYANPEYYSSQFKEYLLKPTNENFVYPMGNFNSKIENNKLTVMNNNWDLSKTTACSSLDNVLSSAVDYTIDASKKTITETWKYEKDYTSFTWGDYTSDKNNKIIMFGREFIEFHTPLETCKLPDEGDFVSYVIILNNNEELFNMKISNSYNYVSKRSIIDNNYSFVKVTPKNFTADQPGDSYNKLDYKDKYNKSVINNIPFELSGNKLKALYYEEKYKIILMDEYGNGYEYIPKNNEINVKKGLGKTIILIEKDTKIYNTGYYINL